MAKKSDINKYNYLYYYCVNHRTTKNSESYTSNNIKKRYLYVKQKYYMKNQQKIIFF